ncbi:hypothetical protein BFP72_00680 [Reichenbachiella sp. 5M10]|uniref:YHYH protein n=1 Tax=Reichenbachiella sp. 5M10 TaxID=1889772 RepID=UPI000C154892|nr:YHYH protein [Reichenbachiella sp. 5M10]PIB34048.1 hypothetical protein BFP72_00680 [Reichenbachiella sp. 5M10]
MKVTKTIWATVLIAAVWIGCSSDGTLSDGDSGVTLTELPAAFSAFDADHVSVLLDGDDIIVETDGLPNHTSPYWSNTTTREMDGVTTQGSSSNHELFVEPTITSYGQMAPGNIDDFNGSYALTVDATPERASSSSATGLGAIGIAVSGAVIYNDEEGPNVPLDNAVGSLDYTGAHTGPQSYHYHLETTAWSEDDDALIGIIADGFFLYGRKCAETGTYPDDLDESGGHTSSTQYNEESVYHYHIQNDLYLNQYYILFPGDYQGTANAIR